MLEYWKAGSNKQDRVAWSRNEVCHTYSDQTPDECPLLLLMCLDARRLNQRYRRLQRQMQLIFDDESRPSSASSRTNEPIHVTDNVNSTLQSISGVLNNSSVLAPPLHHTHRHPRRRVITKRATRTGIVCECCVYRCDLGVISMHYCSYWLTIALLYRNILHIILCLINW